MVIHLLGRELVPQAHENVESMVCPYEFVELLISGQLCQQDGSVLPNHICLLLHDVDQVEYHRLELWDAFRERSDKRRSACTSIDEGRPVLLSVVLGFVEAILEEVVDLFDVCIKCLRGELVLVEAGVLEVFELCQGVQGSEGVQLKTTILVLLVEVEQGLEEGVLLREHLPCRLLARQHLAQEVKDSLYDLSVLGLRRFENGQKRLHVVEHILLQEEAASRCFNRKVDKAGHHLEDHVLPIEGLALHVLPKVFDDAGDNAAHVVGEVGPQLLVGAEVAHEAGQ